MKNNSGLMFVGLLVVVGAVAIFMFMDDIRESVYEMTPEAQPQEKPKVEAVKNTPVTPIVEAQKTADILKSTEPTTKLIEPVSAPDKSTKTATQASDPIRTGIKERWAPIEEKDEYYLGEYRETKSKAKRKAPTLIKDARDQITWKLKFASSVCGRPVSDNGKLYLSTFDRQAFSIDLATGKVLKSKKLWAQPIGNPCIYKDTVIFPQKNGTITAIYKDTMKYKWNHELGVTKSPGDLDISISGATVSGSRILVSKHWGNLYILEASKGIMQMDPGVPYESRINIPAVSWGNKVIYANVAGELLCFSADGKKEIWKDEIPSGYALSMIQSENKLFISTTEREVLALDLKSRKVLWTIKTRGFAFNSLSVNSGKLYAPAGDLYCINPEDGSVDWTFANANKWGFCRGPAIVKKEGIQLLDQSGVFYWLSLDGTQIKSEKLLEGQVWNSIFSDGKILIASSQNKEAICLDLEKFQAKN